MPYLAVATSSEISAEAQAQFLQEASKVVAAGTGKPEQYVMVKLEVGQPMLLAGTNAPTAFLELKSIGFPAGGQSALASALCGLVTRHFAIPGDRVYIVFQDVQAAMWGHDGQTFG